MRILVTSAGSRGDIQPTLALAVGLKERGHAVDFVGTPNFAELVGSYGIPFQGVGRDVEATLRSVGLSIPRALKAMRSDIHEQFADMAPLVHGYDVVVGASLQQAARSHCELLGIPYFHTFYSPQILPSRDHPPPLFSRHGLPRWVNGLAWASWQALGNVLFLRFVNEERGALGLPPAQDVWTYFSAGKLFFAGESSIAPLPAGHDFDIIETGAWILPEREELDVSLVEFIEAGSAPVYIGFGSMPDKHPERTLAAIVKAVHETGLRAVLSSGVAGLGGSDLPKSIRVIGPSPHGKLFPRMAAIVHHGGAGTTVTAARAGIPQLIVPHLVDQFHWAHRVQALGLSPPTIRKGSLTARALTEGLREVTGNRAIRERAREFAKGLSKDGVARAIAHIEAAGGERPLEAVGT